MKTQLDWKQIPENELLNRINTIIKLHRSSDKEYDLSCSTNVRSIYGQDNEVLGRACITTNRFHGNSLPGILTVGGLDSNYLSGITGILSGKALRASRDSSDVAIPPESLADWATEQAELVPNIYSDPQQQADCAGYIYACGGDPGNLPLAKFNGKWLSIEDIRNLPKLQKIYLVSPYDTYGATKNLENVVINDDVMTIDASTSYIVNNRLRFSFNSEDTLFDLNSLNFADELFNALGAAWDVDPAHLFNQYIDSDEEEIPLGTHARGNIVCDGIVVVNPSF